MRWLREKPAVLSPLCMFISTVTFSTLGFSLILFPLQTFLKNVYVTHIWNWKRTNHNNQVLNIWHGMLFRWNVVIITGRYFKHPKWSAIFLPKKWFTFDFLCWERITWDRRGGGGLKQIRCGSIQVIFHGWMDSREKTGETTYLGLRWSDREVR